jgi:hypothetical protein
MKFSFLMAAALSNFKKIMTFEFQASEDSMMARRDKDGEIPIDFSNT